MPLSSLFAHFSALLQSPQFHEHVRHGDHATAFRRCRKLSLPTLVAVMLCGHCHVGGVVAWHCAMKKTKSLYRKHLAARLSEWRRFTEATQVPSVV